jgi:mono/diheme cytochrome c family protein
MSDDPNISSSTDSLEDSKLATSSESSSSGATLFLGYFCIIVAVLLAVIYLGRYSGGFESEVYLESSIIADEMAAMGGVPTDGGPAVEAPLDPVEEGERIYQTNCMACHQVTGQGLPPSFPPLAGSEWVDKDPQLLARIVLYGLNGPITVKGTEFNSIMAPLGAALSDEQIAFVLTYIRQAWGNSAGPVEAEVVTAARSEHGTRGMWTVEELKPWITE